MRLLSIAIAITMFLIVSLTPVQAQTTFTEGYYEFESTIASMTYTGVWTSTTFLSTQIGLRNTAGVGANVVFLASGKSLVIWRAMASNGVSSRMDVCVGAACVLVINESTQANSFLYPVVFTLASGTNTITITRNAGTISLDSFMILSDPSGSFPTAVPTATIVPSATPASTTTPQPTPTPQPTATPYTMPGVVFAIDPARSYESVAGQITATEYSATAADVHLSNLLLMLIFSVWGMFLLQVFVLSRHKK